MFTLSDVTKATIKSKLQLWISYALIGAVIVLAGAAIYNYTTRLKLAADVATLDGKLTHAEDRLVLVESVNKQQAEALDTIKGLNDVNDTMLSGLAADMEALRVRDRTAFNRLAALEKSNEAVRKYLNTAVPAPVGCVLDRTCPDADADPVPATNSGPSTRVPAARAGAQPDKR